MRQVSSVAKRRQPRQARSQELCEIILSAASKLLQERPQGFTTNDLAKRAGVSVGSLYQYFPNRESVIAALMEREFVADAEYIAAQFFTAKDLSVNVRVGAIVKGLVEIHQRNPDLRKVLFLHAKQFESVNKKVFEIQSFLENQFISEILSFLEEHPELDLPGQTHESLYVLFRSVLGTLWLTILECPEKLHQESFHRTLQHLVFSFFSYDSQEKLKEVC